MTARYLAVHVPAFPLERCGYGADDLAALTAEQRSAVRLVASTPAARAAGLRLGMTATEAKALVPDVQLLPLDEAGEREDRAALVRAFGALSDRVAFPWQDALALEISDVARAHGGEAQAAIAAVRLAEELGHRARAAVTDDPIAALAIAEWVAEDGAAVVVPRGEAGRWLAPLPIVALRPYPVGSELAELHAALRAVGVERLGAWAALDPAAVAGRYGRDAARLHLVARGGSAGPTLAVVEDDALPIARAALPGATTRHELAFVLPGLLSELALRLEARDLAAVRLRVTFELDRPGAPTVAASVRVGRPTRSVRALDRLVRQRLEKVALEAPVEALALEVVEATPETGWQPGLADRTEAGEPLPELIARLADQLGDAALFTPIPVDTWRPEAAWRPERFPRPQTLGRAARPPDDPVATQEAREHELPLPRPTLLLPKPERLDVACEQGIPVRVRLEQGWQAVARRSGPERIRGEWWTRDPLDREYWVVEVGGRTAWLCRDEGAWSLHGWFD